MKSLKLISILSFLLCFGLVGCAKNDVFDGEQTKIFANDGGAIPLDTASAIVEIDP